MFVLNIKLPNNVGEDVTLWGANAWTKQMLHKATSDRAEFSYTAVKNGFLVCCVCLSIYMQIVSFCWFRRKDLTIAQTYVNEFGIFNPLNAKLNLICHLLALLGAQHIFHVSGLRVNGYYFVNCAMSLAEFILGVKQHNVMVRILREWWWSTVRFTTLVIIFMHLEIL